MNVRNIAIITSALIAGMAGSYFAMRAGPLYDQVNVDLPYPVTVKDKVLEPGHYEIRQLATAGNSPVIQIFSNDGMKLETSVMTIPALDNNTPSQTEVVLHHFGDDYYFDKIWIQGKNYGYEFILPEDIKARQRERGAPVNVPAAYNSTPDANATPEEREGATPPAAAAPPSAAAEPKTETPAPPSVEEPAAQEERQPTGVVPNQTPSPAPAADSDTSPAGSRDRKMPDTAANWAVWLLSGGGLSGAGIMLRRWAR